jgi:hypothetical protein
MNDVRRGSEFYNLSSDEKKLNRKNFGPLPKDRGPKFGEKKFDTTDVPQTKLSLDHSFPPKDRTPRFGEKAFDTTDQGTKTQKPKTEGIPFLDEKDFTEISDSEEINVDDSMIEPGEPITSEKKLPPLPPQKVNEGMIISEIKLPPPTPKRDRVTKKIEGESKVISNKSKTNDDVLMLDENDLIVDKAPKKASPPESKHLVREKKPSVAAEKTIKISNTHAGISGNSRLKIKETPNTYMEQSRTVDTNEEENAWKTEGNELSQKEAQDEFLPPTSIWGKIKKLFKKGK